MKKMHEQCLYYGLFDACLLCQVCTAADGNSIVVCFVLLNASSSIHNRLSQRCLQIVHDRGIVFIYH